MKKFIRILLLLNLATLAYLIAGSRSELPPLKGAFDGVIKAISELERTSPEQEFMISELKMRVETTKQWTVEVIQEHKRSELPLFGLTLVNILGLFLLNFARKPELSGAENNLPAAPPDRH